MKIIMLGESLARTGGIVSVEKLIIKQAPTEVKISHIATLPNDSTIRKVLVFAQALMLLFWQLLKQEADIVHIHVSERGSAFRQSITTLITWLFHKPVILHTHSPDFHLFYTKLPQFIKAGLSWSFGKSTRFIVLSDSWKNFYMQNLGLKAEQVVVLPNPVKIPVQVPQRINPEKVRFLFLGRFGERKGVFDLIEAFAAIPDAQKARSELTVAGDGDVGRARTLANNLNLTNSITILDWVNEEQRDALLAKADVFVLPSYNEGLPMALLEAMSWELPVITTPVGGIPELVIPYKNGLLIEAGNIPDLSAAIQTLIIDEELRLKLGKNARVTVMPFNVKTYLNSLMDVYSSALK